MPEYLVCTVRTYTAAHRWKVTAVDEDAAYYAARHAEQDVIDTNDILEVGDLETWVEKAFQAGDAYEFEATDTDKE